MAIHALVPAGNNNAAVAPAFPLQNPTCPRCEHAMTRRLVIPENANGNAGRWYYLCEGGCGSKFVCWDDNRGINAGNPPCFCPGGVPSRMDRMGVNSGRAGRGFWGCATGSCGFYSEDREGRSVRFGEVEEEDVEPFFVGETAVYG